MEAPAADLPGHRLELMYVVLTWVFASWSLPLIVMAITPFSLIGALPPGWSMAGSGGQGDTRHP